MKCSDYRSVRCLFSEKETIQIIFGQNCENTTAKKASNKYKGGFLVRKSQHFV